MMKGGRGRSEAGEGAAGGGDKSSIGSGSLGQGLGVEGPTERLGKDDVFCGSLHAKKKEGKVETSFTNENLDENPNAVEVPIKSVITSES